MVVAIAVVAIALVVAGSCTGGPGPSVPAEAFPHLRPGRSAALDAEAVAADAVEPPTLETLLDRAGFVAAAERTFVGDDELRSVTARIVEFSSEGGAREYLGWIQAHAGDLLGIADEAPAIAMPGGTRARSYTATPDGCCPKAMTTSLATWRRGPRVLTVLAVGAAADPTGLAELALKLDDAAGPMTGEG